MTGEQLMTVVEFGRRIGKSRTAAYRIVVAGDIAVVNVGSRQRPQLRISETDLRAYIEARRIQARAS